MLGTFSSFLQVQTPLNGGFAFVLERIPIKKLDKYLKKQYTGII